MKKSEFKNLIREAILEAKLNEAITVNTSYFEGSHGKKPSGFGSWAFSFDNAGNSADVTSKDTFWVRSSKYSDAVKKAKVEAKKRGAQQINVMS